MKLKIKLSDIKYDDDDEDIINEQLRRKEEKRKKKDEKRERRKQKKMLKLQNKALKIEDNLSNVNECLENFIIQKNCTKDDLNIVQSISINSETSKFEHNITQKKSPRVPCWRDNIPTTSPVIEESKKEYVSETKTDLLNNKSNGIKLRISKLILSSLPFPECDVFETSKPKSKNGFKKIKDDISEKYNKEIKQQKNHINKFDNEKRHKTNRKRKIENATDVIYKSQIIEQGQVSTLPRIKLRLENCTIKNVSENSLKFKRSKNSHLESNLFFENETDADYNVKAKRRRRNKNENNIKSKSKKNNGENNDISLLNNTISTNNYESTMNHLLNSI